MTRTVLIVRLDSMGDVLITGPAVRAVAATADRVVMLAGPLGAAAARMLPGVAEVLVFDCPWVGKPAKPFEAIDVKRVIDGIVTLDVDEALILTSFHQSPLPTALLLRLAGVRRIAAASEDYPGSLLDVRVPVPGDQPEPIRMLEIARGAGYEPRPDDDARLAVRRPSTASQASWKSERDYIVLHPGTSAPARAYPADRWAATVGYLVERGWLVVLTGSEAERHLTAGIATASGRSRTGDVVDLGGRLTLEGLAAVLDGASAIVVANTGPAHLAAAVGTPVVSLFSPVVSATRWVPHGVPTIVLGDQQAPCRDSRSVLCPVEGHPCLGTIDAAAIAAAVETLVADLAPTGVAAR
jgi:ADP-heptose:LPS heptosyltransferase